MRSLQEAKSIAEAECTESTNKYRKTSRFAIRVLVVVIALGLRSVGVTEVITKHQLPVPQRANCQLYFNSTDVSKCVISEKAVEVTSNQLTAAGEFGFCVVVPQGSPIRIEHVRTNTFRMWSTDGSFPAEFKWVRREALVNGNCPSTF